MKWTRIDRPFPLPSYVKDALEKLDDDGFVAYVVGGSVRDFLLGKEPKDHDIATSADPDELVRVFPDAVTVGKAFGVLKIPVPAEAGRPASLLEVASFREDLEYADHRHPKRVRFTGPYEDAQRRDFTVNGMFYDPKTSRILDCVGGIDDLRRGLVRAIGDPKARFLEDALRLLRAVRFSASLAFRMDDETAAALKLRAKLIEKISLERVRDEMTLMVTGPNPALAVMLLSELALLPRVLPELEALRGVKNTPAYGAENDVWSHTLRMMTWLVKNHPSRSSTLAWGALLHAIGKPLAARKSGGKNFNGHEIEGARIAQLVCERLRMPKSEIDAIVSLVSDHVKFRDVFQMREATLQRFVAQPNFEELLALHKAESVALDGNLAFYEFCSTRLAELRTQGETPRLLSGEDLRELGIKPGPIYSEILRAVEDLTMERKLRSKEEALEYVVKQFVR